MHPDETRLPNRHVFQEKLQEIINKKQRDDNTNFFTQQDYATYLKETKQAQGKKLQIEENKKRIEEGLPPGPRVTLTTKDGRRLQRFSVVTINGKEKLIVPIDSGNPQKMVFFVTIDEYYDLILEVHLAEGHKGRNVLMPKLQATYKNIPREVVQLFLDLCPTCLLKKKTKKRGLTVKPMVFHQMNDRWQIDLVDMQSAADGEFRWIFVCQDHLTKFIHLRALTSKRAVEVAEHLLEIMLVFGAPSILQSDNGREFVNQIIESLKDTWPELKIVHGSPRHSQSQGSVERANQDIQDMLSAWMLTYRTKQWSKGLKYVASQN